MICIGLILKTRGTQCTPPARYKIHRPFVTQELDSIDLPCVEEEKDQHIDATITDPSPAQSQFWSSEVTKQVPAAQNKQILNARSELNMFGDVSAPVGVVPSLKALAGTLIYFYLYIIFIIFYLLIYLFWFYFII